MESEVRQFLIEEKGCLQCQSAGFTLRAAGPPRSLGHRSDTEMRH
jgi:hypothetical protein